MSITNVVLSGKVLEVVKQDNYAALVFQPNDSDINFPVEVYGKKKIEILPDDESFDATIVGFLRLTKDDDMDYAEIPYIKAVEVVPGTANFKTITVEGSCGKFKDKTIGKLNLTEFSIGALDYNPDSKENEWSNYRGKATFNTKTRLDKLIDFENDKFNIRMSVFGMVSFNTWTDKEGIVHIVTAVDVEEFALAPRPKQETTTSSNTSRTNTRSKYMTKTTKTKDVDLNDIPF